MSARLVRVLGQPKLANWFCRAPSLVGSDASVHGGLRRLPHVLGRAAPVAGLGDAMVLDAYGARELRHARIIELKQNDMATSSAILCFALHRALITRRLQARCHQGAA